MKIKKGDIVLLRDFSVHTIEGTDYPYIYRNGHYQWYYDDGKHVSYTMYNVIGKSIQKPMINGEIVSHKTYILMMTPIKNLLENCKIYRPLN